MNLFRCLLYFVSYTISATYYVPPYEGNVLRRRQQGIQRQNDPFLIDLTMLGKLDQHLGNITAYDRYSCIPRILCEGLSRRHAATSTVRPAIDSTQSNGLKRNRFEETSTEFNPFSLRSILSIADLIFDIAKMHSYRYAHAAYMGTQMSHPKYCRTLYPRCPDDISNLAHAIEVYRNQPSKMQHRMTNFFRNLLKRNTGDKT